MHFNRVRVIYCMLVRFGAHMWPSWGRCIVCWSGLGHTCGHLEGDLLYVGQVWGTHVAILRAIYCILVRFGAHMWPSWGRFIVYWSGLGHTCGHL